MKTANLAIVFIELDGFGERSARQSHEQNQHLLAQYAQLTAPVVKAFAGRVVKSLGASYLAVFESPTQAVLSGIALQDRCWQLNRTLPEGERLLLKVAINLGEVRLESGDVFGEPVNTAARVEALTEPGEVFLTESTYLSMNKAEVPSAEVGSFTLKGIPGQVKVFRVPRAPYRVQGAAAVEDAPAPAAGAPSESPPFGNLGLARMPESPTGGFAAELRETLSATTTAALGAVSASRRSRRWMLVPVAGVAVLALALIALRGSPVSRAIDAVASAPPEEREARIDAARALVLEEKDPVEQAFDSGRLSEAMGQPGRAVRDYRTAAQQGSRAAQSRLVDLLDSPECDARAGAARALGALKLTRARAKLEELAEKGGPGDGVDLVVIGCNSRRAAADALAQMP